MHWIVRITPAFALVTLCGGCGVEEPGPAEGRISRSIESPNGRSLNGTSLNGRSLNGISLNGVSLNGVALGGVRLSGSSLTAVDADGDALGGPDLIGAGLTGTLEDGTKVSLRIDDVRQAPAPNADVYYYSVSYQSGGFWQPVCGFDAVGAAVPTVALGGTWSSQQGVPGGGAKSEDPGVFTLACDGSTIAKCVMLGYKPWSTAHGVSLDAYHQSCVRMIRADYCGDGAPWTVNGRPINLYDGLGVQADTERWAFEAEWTPAGARCLSNERVTSLKNLLGSVSACILSRVSLTCGNTGHFANGTQLMNEYQSIYLSLPLGLAL